MEAFLHPLTDNAAVESINNLLSNIMPYFESSLQHPGLLAAGGALSYILLCRSLRYRRVNAQGKRLGYTTQESMSQMTNVDAQLIIQDMAQLEFPLLFKNSLNFALFKTYGVPSISDLLVATRMFSTRENASKRYEDTSVLIGEFLSHDPREQRTAEAIARMNYLHRPYIKAGKISNDDLLYTLSVFITEPIAWIDRFEWRKTTDLEICALSTFWKSIGDAMGIDYSALEHDFWETGLDFYSDIRDWAKFYEAKTMVPCKTNKITADQLVPLLLFYVPRPLMGFAGEVVGVLMGERLGWAMSYPEPSLAGSAITFTAIATRRFVLRYLTLPRIFNKTEFTSKDSVTGKYYHEDYLVHPYYVKPTILSRWGPSACMTRLLGGFVPGGKDGQKYHPDGYTMTEVGPDKQRGQGGGDLKALSQAVNAARPSGCPFSVK